MTRTRTFRRQMISLVALLLGALLGTVLASGMVSARAGDTTVTSVTAHASHAAVATTPRTSRAAFHDQMRKLWEDHVTWTRLAIVTFAAGSAGFDATAARLLQNQRDIGNAIAPYYGTAAGNRLTALLHDHITIAVEVLRAAKAGDTAAFTAADARWYANANDIADFLAAANPRSWPRAVMRADMQAHLDQTLAEAAHELGGQYAASVTDYEAVHAHILMMADQLSAGIIAQFPSRFR
ncbi:hypothetical protein ACXR8F_03520 [Terrabacter sp. AAH1]